MKKQRLSAAAIIVVILLSLAAILINFYLWRRTQNRSAPETRMETPRTNVSQP